MTKFGEAEMKREELSKLIDRLACEPFFGEPDEELPTLDTSMNAKKFLAALPIDYRLPKIAPDAEGGIYMIWGMRDEHSVIVWIKNHEICAVVDPGMPKSHHIQEMKFDGSVIPSEILKFIPSHVSDGEPK